MTKNKIFRFDSSYDQPGQHQYSVMFTPDDLPGLLALKNISAWVNYYGKRWKLVGYSELSEARKNYIRDILARIGGEKFNGIKGEFACFAKPNNGTIGYYYDVACCARDRLYPKVCNVGKVDDSDLGKQQGYVVYSERVPQVGVYIGYKVPFSQSAYDERLQKDRENDVAGATAKLTIAELGAKAVTFKRVSEEEETKIENENTTQEQLKNKQALYKGIRWTSIGIVAAAVVAVIITAVIIVKRKK